MVDLKDISILVHFKPDVRERVENQGVLDDYYHAHAENVEIIYACEHNDYGDDWFCNVKPIMDTGDKWFEFDGDRETYHRTKGFALAAKRTDRPIVVLHDTDAIIDPKFLQLAGEEVRQTKGVCVCHNGLFLDFDQEVKEEFADSLDIKTFKEFIDKDPKTMRLLERHNHLTLIHNKAVGASVAVWKENLNKVNCNFFVGWGFEDNARLELARKLIGQDAVARISDEEAVMYHLCHPGSVKNNHPYYARNSALNNFITNLPEKYLKEFEKTWQI